MHGREIWSFVSGLLLLALVTLLAFFWTLSRRIGADLDVTVIVTLAIAVVAYLAFWAWRSFEARISVASLSFLIGSWPFVCKLLNNVAIHREEVVLLLSEKSIWYVQWWFQWGVGGVLMAALVYLMICNN